MTTAEFHHRLRRLVYRPRPEMKQIADSLGLRGPISAGLVRYHLEKLAAVDYETATFHLTAPFTTATQAVAAAASTNAHPASAGASEMTFEVHPITPVISLDSFRPTPDGTLIATFVDARRCIALQIPVSPGVATSADRLARAVRDGSGGGYVLNGNLSDLALAHRLDDVAPAATFSFSLADGPSARPAVQSRRSACQPTAPRTQQNPPTRTPPPAQPPARRMSPDDVARMAAAFHSLGLVHPAPSPARLRALLAKTPLGRAVLADQDATR